MPETLSTNLEQIDGVDSLERRLAEPTPGVIETMSRLEGDLLILGVGGKMGPTLAAMARRASDHAGVNRRVIGVSRFGSASSQTIEARLLEQGVETVRADLLDPRQLKDLPEAPHIIYMAGMKFGSTGGESRTWAMNSFLPGAVCRRYPASRLAVFSTGNIYGLCPMARGGSVEGDAPAPVGEYAMSCLGRERVFEHFSRVHEQPVSILRLNYAVELRYGVLVDLAMKLRRGQPIDLAMGAFNVIWQQDANAMALRSLEAASSPPAVLNLAGPELLSVRRVCRQMGERMGKEPRFTGEEGPDAILSNAQRAHEMFGYPHVPARPLIDRTADWIAADGGLLGKPTHFESRDGKF